MVLNISEDLLWTGLWWGLGTNTNLGMLRRMATKRKLRLVGFRDLDSTDLLAQEDHWAGLLADSGGSSDVPVEVVQKARLAVEAAGLGLQWVPPSEMKFQEPVSVDALIRSDVEPRLLWTTVMPDPEDMVTRIPAEPPKVGHPGDVGLDMATTAPAVCDPHTVTYIPLGIKVRLPDGVWGYIVGRSSAMRKHGVWVVQGVIDNGYTGPLFAGVVPVGHQEVTIPAGVRIAQMLLLPMLERQPKIEWVLNLPETERGDNGFGSTGP
jgi:dUTP pyrophosphatase